MTSKQIYEATAIELSKVQAPALKLYEFNYFFNQAIRLFVNKVYNVYDINQQTTDDLRVLKATATLKPALAASTGNNAIDYLRGATYFVDMPDDYLHLLNCICLFDVNKKKECWNPGDVMVVGATKLTADSWSSVVDDVYNQPTKKRPYYYVHNQNDIDADATTHELTLANSALPSNLDTDALHGNAIYTPTALPQAVATAVNTASEVSGATALSVLYAAKNAAAMDAAVLQAIAEVESNLSTTATAAEAKTALTNKLYNVLSLESNFPRTFNFVNDEESTVEKSAGSRHANSSRVKVEIRCGRDKSNIFSLSAVQIDYVKAPQFIRLTQEQLDSDEDTSQIMEFPDYVNQEIVNELVNLVMRKTNDPSLQAHMLITQSIARPTGQLQQPAALA